MTASLALAQPVDITGSGADAPDDKPAVPAYSFPMTVPPAGDVGGVVPVDLGKPIKSQTLAAPDQDSNGLLTAAQGGLGTGIWGKTPRAFVEKTLQTSPLPTTSPALNALARRLMLTNTEAPQGKSSSDKSLTELRIAGLLALGAADEAAQFAALVKTDRLSDDLLQALTLAGLLTTDGKDVCDKIPAYIGAHGSLDRASVAWQEKQILCKLKAGDKDGAQLGLDLLREQKTTTDGFMTIASDNILGGDKKLARTVKPGDPMTLAALRLTDIAMPTAFYVDGPALLMTELVKAKAEDEKARISMAERAAAAGLIPASALAEAYLAPGFAGEELQAPLDAKDKGTITHALLYQSLRAEQDPGKQVQLLQRLADTLGIGHIKGNLAKMLGEQVARIQPSPERSGFAALAARILIMAGMDGVQGWTALLPQTPADWPLYVLSGAGRDGGFAKDAQDWLTAQAKADDTPQSRAKADGVMAILAAAGYSVPDDVLTRFAGSAPGAKVEEPSPLLMDRLIRAADKNKKGEAALLTIALYARQKDGHSLNLAVQAVRALKGAGLDDDARALAREDIAELIAP